MIERVEREREREIVGWVDGVEDVEKMDGAEKARAWWRGRMVMEGRLER